MEHALSLVIQHTQVELRIRVSLCHGFFKPLPRLDIVLGHALAVVIHRTQVVLRNRISLFGQRTQLIQDCCVVSTVIGVHASFKIGPCRTG